MHYSEYFISSFFWKRIVLILKYSSFFLTLSEMQRFSFTRTGLDPDKIHVDYIFLLSAKNISTYVYIDMMSIFMVTKTWNLHLNYIKT